MKTLQSFKDEIAKKHGYANWSEYITIRGDSTLHIPELLNTLDSAAELYATSQIEELTKEVERLKIELSNYAYQIDRAKRDRDKAESLNDRYREENEMSPRVASLLIKVRDEIAKEDIAEAYHTLYQIASPDFDKTEPWEKVEKIAVLHPLKEGE